MKYEFCLGEYFTQGLWLYKLSKVKFVEKTAGKIVSKTNQANKVIKGFFIWLIIIERKSIYDIVLRSIVEKSLNTWNLVIDLKSLLPLCDKNILITECKVCPGEYFAKVLPCTDQAKRGLCERPLAKYSYWQTKQTRLLRFLLYGSSLSEKTINNIVLKSAAEKCLYGKLRT